MLLYNSQKIILKLDCAYQIYQSKKYEVHFPMKLKWQIYHYS